MPKEEYYSTLEDMKSAAANPATKNVMAITSFKSKSRLNVYNYFLLFRIQ